MAGYCEEAYRHRAPRERTRGKEAYGQTVKNPEAKNPRWQATLCQNAQRNSHNIFFCDYFENGYSKSFSKFGIKIYILYTFFFCHEKYENCILTLNTFIEEKIDIYKSY